MSWFKRSYRRSTPRGGVQGPGGSGLWLLGVFTAVLWLAGPAAAQQTGTIRGQVVNETTRQPLAGVQVFVEGSRLEGRRVGTLTGRDGRYSLEGVPAGQPVRVRAQMIGFSSGDRTVTVAAGATETVDFSIRPSAIELDEVVVTGAGVATERRKLGNTIATINTDRLENAPVQNLSEMLQGREPGVVGLPSGGMAGEGSQIRIRGSSSISQSNEPVVYIDGVRVDISGGFAGGLSAGGGGSPSRLDDINPDAIERIEILKGAAAATLYGTQASNGVIQIFTKKGLAGTPKWTFQVEQGLVDFPEERYKQNAGFARDAEQAQRMSEFYGRTISPFEVIEVPFAREVYETGYGQMYSGSVSGGSDQVTYFVSGRWQKEDGPLALDKFARVQEINDGVDRRQGSLTVNLLPTDALRLRVTSLYSENYTTVPNNNNNIYAPATLAMFGKPERVFCNREIVAPRTCSEEGGNPMGQAAFATVREGSQVTIEDAAQHFNGSITADYSLLPSVSLSGTFGVDFVSQRSFEFAPFGYAVDDFTRNFPEGFRNLTEENQREVTLDGKALWNTDFSPDLSSSFVLGAQAFISEANTAGGFGYNFPGPGLEVVSAASVKDDIYEFFLSETVAGVFAQEQLGWRDFAFLTLGARYDASSAFGTNFQGVLYPKVSLSVIPSSLAGWGEPLGLSTFRVRAALGRSGLQPGAFDKFTTFSPLATSVGPGLQPANLGNPDLSPEVSTEWEVGAELGLLRDRVALEATYWDRTVDDALVPRQFPVSGGFLRQQLVNIGQIRGRGVELGLRGTAVARENVGMDVFATGSYLWENVTDLGGAPELKVGGSYPRYRNFIREGYSPGALFGAQLLPVGAGRVPYDTNGDGQPDTEQELAAFLANPIDPGALASRYLMLQDPDGDGPLTVLDNYLGKPTPDWTGSFGTDLVLFRNWRINSLWEFKAGNFMMTNLTDAFRKANPVIGRNIRGAAEVEAALINPASTPDQRVEAAKLWATEYQALAPFSGLNTMESGDFIRWRELSLTYSVPGGLIQTARLPFDNMSVSLAGRNVALWTGYSGIDPEVNVYGRGGAGNFSQNFGQSIDAFGVAIPRRYTVSVRVGF